MEYIYHGSTVPNIKILKPQKRFTPAGSIDFPATYASPLRSYAIAHGFPWDSSRGFDVEIKDGQTILYVPKKYRDELNIPIYLYKISKDTFVKTKEESLGFTWHSIVEVPVLDIEKYESVTKALEKNNGLIKII